MICPISGSACVDCPVYRGRHYYMCHGVEYKRSSENSPEEVDIFRLFFEGCTEDLERVIRNVEEFIERSEL